MKKCSGYCGPACVGGSYPNALREENPEYYEMCYGSLKKYSAGIALIITVVKIAA